MTAGSYHSPALHRAQTRPTAPHAANSAAVLAYLDAGHSNAETAAHFGIHERSVRRIKQRQLERSAQGDPMGSSRTLPCVEDRPSSVVARTARTYETRSVDRIFPETTDDIAGDHTSWRCPVSGELLPVVPGSRRKAWETERRASHARHLAAVAFGGARQEPPNIDYVVSPVRTLDECATLHSPDRTADTPAAALESDETGGQVRTEERRSNSISPDVRTSPALAAFLAQRLIEPMPRLPLRNAGPWWQTSERGLLGLLVDEEGPYSGRIVGLLVLLCLIVATWMG